MENSLNSSSMQLNNSDSRNMNNNNDILPLQKPSIPQSFDYRAFLRKKHAMSKIRFVSSDDDSSDSEDSVIENDTLDTPKEYEPSANDEAVEEKNMAIAIAADQNKIDKLPSKLSSADCTVLLKVSITELKLSKCLRVLIGESVWNAKQRIIITLVKKLPDAFNYGFFCPKLGQFLLDHKLMSEYVEADSVAAFELRYKRRVYHEVFKSLKDSRDLLKMQSAAKRKEFINYVIRGNVDKVNNMLRKGIDPNFCCATSSETPLTLASTKNYQNGNMLFVGTSSPLITSLVGGGAHLDFRNRRGYTPLHVAVRTGNCSALQTLLDLKASPDVMDSSDLSPLYHCSLFDTGLECIRPLYESGTKLDCVNSQGWTFLHQACRYGRVAHVEAFLNLLRSCKKHKKLIDAQNESGNTALHVCALYNKEMCLATLLKHDADTSLRNYAHQDPFQVAVIAGNNSLSRLFKESNSAFGDCKTMNNGEGNKGATELQQEKYASRFQRHTITPGALTKADRLSAFMIGTSFCKNDPQISQAMSLNCDLDLPPNATLPRAFHHLSLDTGNSKRRLIPAFNSDEPEWIMYIACKNYPAKNKGELNIRIGELVAVSTLDNADLPEGYCRAKHNSDVGLIPTSCLQAVDIHAFKREELLLHESKGTVEANLSKKISSGAQGDSLTGMSNPSISTSMHSSDSGLLSTSCSDIFHRCRNVILSKGTDGYGFVLRGAKSIGPIEKFSPTAVHPGLQYLESVDEGSNAYQVGLRTGDFIITINDKDVTRMGHKETVNLIRNAGDPIRLRSVSVVKKTGSANGKISGSAAHSSLTLSAKGSGPIMSSDQRANVSPSVLRQNRSGSIRSAIGKLDHVLAMEEDTVDTSDEATATLRRRPVSRSLYAKDIQEIFERKGSTNREQRLPSTGSATTGAREIRSMSAATSRRLIRVLPPTLPKAPDANRVVFDEISPGYDSSISSTTYKSEQNYSNVATPSVSATGSSSEASVIPSSFQAGVDPASTLQNTGTTRKPPAPPQRRTSRLTSNNVSTNPYGTTEEVSTRKPVSPLVAASSNSSSAKMFPNKYNTVHVDNKASRPVLSGIASAVAVAAQNRHHRLSSEGSSEELVSPTSPTTIASKPPSIAPKPGREKIDARKDSNEPKSALALALAAKRASIQQRDASTGQTNNERTDLVKKRFETKEETTKKSEIEKQLNTNSVTSHLPNPPTISPCDDHNASFILPPPPPPPSQNVGKFLEDEMLLPPPPAAMLQSYDPNPVVAGTGNKDNKQRNDFAKTNSLSKVTESHSGVAGTLSIALDSVSNADSGFGDIGINSQNIHNEGKANIETLSVSTISSEDGSDAGVSLSYQPKTDTSTKSVPEKHSVNCSNEAENAIVLTKVHFGAAKKPHKTDIKSATPNTLSPGKKYSTSPSSPVPNGTINKNFSSNSDSKPLPKWTADDVSNWLNDLGLSVYAQAFIDNEIDGSHLPDLGKEELQELGVTRMGHRLTIERSIKKFLK